MEFIIIISLLLVCMTYAIFAWNKKRSLGKKSDIQTFAYRKLAASFVDMGLSLIGRKTPDTTNSPFDIGKRENARKYREKFS